MTLPSFMAFPFIVVPMSGEGVEGENNPSTVSFAEDSGASPKRSVMDISMSMSRSSSMGLSAELPRVESNIMPALFEDGSVSSGIVRSMSIGLLADWALEAEAKVIKSGGSSLAAKGRADRGASVTGEARPLVNNEGSSFIRCEMEERSSFGGGRGRCKEERNIVEGRREGGMTGPTTTEVEGSPVGTWFEDRVSAWVDELGGRGIRLDDGDNETDLERVLVDIAAVLASSICRSSRARSRSRTEMARS
jgi:hypothetical protein